MVGLVKRRGRDKTKNICASCIGMETVWELTGRRGSWRERDKWGKIGATVIALTIKKI